MTFWAWYWLIFVGSLVAVVVGAFYLILWLEGKEDD